MTDDSVLASHDTSDALAIGFAALRAGDTAAARRAFAGAYEFSPDDGHVLEGLARTAYLELDFTGAVEEWKRAYSSYRAAGDQVSAIRAARTLGFLHGAVLGDWAVMNGWIARAQTLLAGAPDSAEAGWVSLTFGMFDGDRAAKHEQFERALTVARSVGDADLEFVTLAYFGASLVHADRAEEGMVLLDEALAAVAGQEVDDFLVLEEIFCQLFSACEHAHDVERADQWMRVGDDIARRRNLPAVSAFCRTHYGGVLTAAGRWPEADAALTEAVRLWGLGYVSLRAGALVRLADLRVRQGRFEEAEQLLDGLKDSAEAARPLAAIELARAQTALARHILERALDQLDPAGSASAPLLALLVDVHLAAGALDDAAAASARLDACAAVHRSDYLVATAALVRGLVCLARGDGDPCAGLSEALAAFSRARMPMEMARSRLELATVLAPDRPEAAVAEARAALDAFERLQAARHADAAAALLRTLGTKTASARTTGAVLTKREAEVLGLLGHGLTNPEIADRLYISRKTVEHHVGNILAKLGLRSRSEAAAYATRTGSAQK
jgi:DNA-binding CsgD family transcriptional regulator/Tfp pilus assembly protein PilF